MTAVKRLKASAIIPADLYVDRAADRQLDQVVSEMGRPPYVLVARQMGKTNLLINLKRRREAQGDVVVYLDLTNRFSEARGLFRHFIDAVVETSGEISNDTLSELSRIRKDAGLQPNIEFDRSMRAVLADQPSTRFVIVLDEIDSLINVSYSDVIFAQIRSMYFSRINHPVYERLTYVLSGVAEPSDLIKDKNISPFNIGEKIYLDDFSREEVDLFVGKASLNFTAEIVDDVYGWTSGNPRMIWDVCSELEDRLQAEGSLKSSDVASAVEKLYLLRFDLPPVDHIRTIVEGDPEVRNAVISIRWGKASVLSERQKSKLYLAGITGAVSGNDVSIKSRVIDLALSDSWLAQITARKKGLLDAAAEEFLLDRYREVIGLIAAYQSSEGAGKALPAVSSYHLGIAKQVLGDNVGAIPELLAAIEGATLDGEQRVRAKFHLASAFVLTKAYEDSIGHYREVIGADGPFKYPAMLGCGTAYLNLDPRKHFSTVLDLHGAVIQAIEGGGGEGIPSSQDVRTSARFNLAQAYLHNGRKEDALKLTDEAIAQSSPSMLPQLYLFRGVLTSNDNYSSWVLKAAEAVESSHLQFVDMQGSALHFSESVLALLLTSLNALKAQESFDRLLQYSMNHLYGAPRRAFDLLVQLARAGDTPKELAERSDLLSLAVGKYADEGVEPVKYEDAVRTLALNAPASKREMAINAYLERIPNRLAADLPFSEDDLIAILNATMLRARNKMFNETLGVVDVGKRVAAKFPQYEKLFTILLMNQEFVTLRDFKMSARARDVSLDLLKRIDDLQPGVDAQASESLASIRNLALDFLKSPQSDPFSKYKRNDKVTVRDRAGAVFVKKFKFVERDLRAGVLDLQDGNP